MLLQLFIKPDLQHTATLVATQQSDVYMAKRSVGDVQLFHCAANQSQTNKNWAEERHRTELHPNYASKVIGLSLT